MGLHDTRKSIDQQQKIDFISNLLPTQEEVDTMACLMAEYNDNGITRINKDRARGFSECYDWICLRIN